MRAAGRRGTRPRSAEFPKTPFIARCVRPARQPTRPLPRPRSRGPALRVPREPPQTVCPVPRWLAPCAHPPCLRRDGTPAHSVPSCLLVMLAEGLPHTRTRMRTHTHARTTPRTAHTLARTHAAAHMRAHTHRGCHWQAYTDLPAQMEKIVPKCG